MALTLGGWMLPPCSHMSKALAFPSPSVVVLEKQYLSRFHDERMVNFGRGPIAVPELHEYLCGLCGSILKDCGMPRLDLPWEKHPHSLTLLE
mmetsp:Transcript_78027/g.150752  ORF Transcript_78027/g.150752 Transcript_78027/m.150752 type:complete len:92 (+) Transcript_78027:45-320(+)